MLKHPNLTMGKQVIVTDGFDNRSTVDHKGNADGGVVGVGDQLITCSGLTPDAVLANLIQLCARNYGFSVLITMGNGGSRVFKAMEALSKDMRFKGYLINMGSARNYTKALSVAETVFSKGPQQSGVSAALNFADDGQPGGGTQEHQLQQRLMDLIPIPPSENEELKDWVNGVTESRTGKYVLIPKDNGKTTNLLGDLVIAVINHCPIGTSFKAAKAFPKEQNYQTQFKPIMNRLFLDLARVNPTSGWLGRVVEKAKDAAGYKVTRHISK